MSFWRINEIKRFHVPNKNLPEKNSKFAAIIMIKKRKLNWTWKLDDLKVPSCHVQHWLIVSHQMKNDSLTPCFCLSEGNQSLQKQSLQDSNRSLDRNSLNEIPEQKTKQKKLLSLQQYILHTPCQLHYTEWNISIKQFYRL